MKVAAKPQLKVINGGNSVGVATLNKANWRNRENKRAHLRVASQLQVDQDNCRAMQRHKVGEYDTWIDRFAVALIEMDCNPYAADVLHEQRTLRMVTRLYAGGLTAEQAAAVMYRYRYGGYPFPSGGKRR